VRIAIDTNVLVRFLTKDHPEQFRRARAEIESADVLVLSTAMLCEAVWVLQRTYRLPHPDIVAVLRGLTETDNAVFDEQAVLAGIAAMESGVDFADGAIASEGAERGAEVFVSFDKRAVSRLCDLGLPARLPQP
jgi:Predicted nucleic-acid-binding protein, contains PIN domain